MISLDGARNMRQLREIGKWTGRRVRLLDVVRQKIRAKQYSLRNRARCRWRSTAVVRSRNCVTGIVRTLAAFRGLASVDALFLRFSCMSVSGSVTGNGPRAWTHFHAPLLRSNRPNVSGAARPRAEPSGLHRPSVEWSRRGATHCSCGRRAGPREVNAGLDSKPMRVWPRSTGRRAVTFKNLHRLKYVVSVARPTAWNPAAKVTYAGVAFSPSSNEGVLSACTTKMYRCGGCPGGGAAPP